MPLPLGQAHPDRLDHLVGNQVPIPQPELVVVAQRQGPARALHRLFRLVETVPKLAGTAGRHSSEQMGCEHEVEGSVQFVLRQIGGCLLHGLDRFPQQQHFSSHGIHTGPQTPQEGMGLRQPFTTSPLLLKQKRHRIKAKAVDPTLQPEVNHLEHGLLHPRVGVVEVGLMAQETVQVVLLRHWIPLPVGRFKVPEQHRGVAVAGWVVAPDVHIPFSAALRGPAGSLEPGVKVAGVVQHQIENHAHALAVGCRQKPMERRQIAQVRVNVFEVGDVVATIP